MITSSNFWPERRRVLIGGLIAAAAIAVTVLLLSGASPRASSAHTSVHVASSPIPSPSSPRSSVTSAPAPGPTPLLPGLPRTDDPAAYAKAVATVLFAVNPAVVTRRAFVQFWQDQLPTVVYSDAASKGLTLAVQNTDAIDNLTASWIPAQDAWTGEAAEHTTNNLTITSVSVPDYWVNAISAGRFRDPGLRMERVMGVLTQTFGTDSTDRHTTARSIVIDLGLLCGPTQPGGCRLLAPQQPPGLGDS